MKTRLQEIITNYCRTLVQRYSRFLCSIIFFKDFKALLKWSPESSELSHILYNFHGQFDEAVIIMFFSVLRYFNLNGLSSVASQETRMNDPNTHQNSKRFSESVQDKHEDTLIKLEDFAVDAGLHQGDNEVDNKKNNGYTKTKSEMLVKKISEKTFKILDITANNHGIANYCQSLVSLSFYGQCENNTNKTRLSYFLDKPDEMSLSSFLHSLDSFLRTFTTADDVQGDEEEFIYYLQGIMEKRGRNDREFFINDAKRFLKIYKSRGTPSDLLTHLDYWGTRQQLLAGKVIADFVDILHGPMDPIFGALLCPVAGRAGPGDSGVVHQVLFDVDGPLAYHSAVHDAFGYLLTFHGIGPGYNYIGAETVLEATQCMSGQVSGLYFWKQLLKSKKL